MSLALHGHHILLIATLTFVTAVLVPSWYTSPDFQIKRNILDTCYTNPYRCYWTLTLSSNSNTIQTLFPIITASLAIGCAGMSLFGLLFGSWYIQRYSGDIGSKWLLLFTIVCVFLSFIASCAVWALMLVTNLYQNGTTIKYVRLQDFGFSLWINIGASGGYLYAFFIYLIAACKNS